MSNPFYPEGVTDADIDRIGEPLATDEEQKIICPICDGKGWTEGHDPGAYSHDGNGNCNGYCPIQIECENCHGKGYGYL